MHRTARTTRPTRTTARWRSGIAAAAALALPLSVAACDDPQTDDPGGSQTDHTGNPEGTGEDDTHPGDD